LETHSVYQLLYAYEKDFSELFKVKADFDITIERNDENVGRDMSFVCTLCRRENLAHLDREDAMKVVAYSSRLANDQQKLSTRFGVVADLVREANFYASQDKSSLVQVEYVKKALEEKTYLSNLIQEKRAVDTSGMAVDQINGLSVSMIGDLVRAPVEGHCECRAGRGRCG